MNARISIGADHAFHVGGDRADDGRSAGAPDSGVGLRSVVNGWIDMIAPAPWGAHVGLHVPHPGRTHPSQSPASQSPGAHAGRRSAKTRAPLYTPIERARRDSTYWTLVQGVLAPLQFLTFAISLGLVARYLMTGEGYALATASILVKTVLLYTIMITGSIWEKVVFGKWLFAPAFFWEDVCSMLVLALQTAYLASLVFSWGSPREQMLIAVAAYLVYVVNATQFVLKLREARLQGRSAAA
jgi:3-vinyl bacteriochlorophyllide hydratase